MGEKVWLMACQHVQRRPRRTSRREFNKMFQSLSFWDDEREAGKKMCSKGEKFEIFSLFIWNMKLYGSYVAYPPNRISPDSSDIV